MARATDEVFSDRPLTPDQRTPDLNQDVPTPEDSAPALSLADGSKKHLTGLPVLPRAYGSVPRENPCVSEPMLG